MLRRRRSSRNIGVLSAVLLAHVTTNHCLSQETNGEAQPTLNDELDHHESPPRTDVFVEMVYGTDDERVEVVSEDLDKVGESAVKRTFSVNSLSFRHRFNRKWSMLATVPFVRIREKGSFLQTKATRSNSGLGDVTINFPFSIPARKGSSWSYTLTPGLSLPTGKSIYDLTPDELPLGTGHAKINLTGSVRWTKLPTTIQLELGYGHNLRRRVHATTEEEPHDVVILHEGHEHDGDDDDAPQLTGRVGNTYFADIAMIYNVSEKLASATSLYLGRSNDILPIASGRNLSVNQAYLSQRFVFVPGKDSSLVGSVSLGLTDSSSDAIFALSYRRGFDIFAKGRSAHNGTIPNIPANRVNIPTPPTLNKRQIAEMVVKVNAGITIEQVCAEYGITAEQYQVWSKKFDSRKLSQGDRLLLLEAENALLKKLINDMGEKRNVAGSFVSGTTTGVITPSR